MDAVLLALRRLIFGNPTDQLVVCDESAKRLYE